MKFKLANFKLFYNSVFVVCRGGESTPTVPGKMLPLHASIHPYPILIMN